MSALPLRAENDQGHLAPVSSEPVERNGALQPKNGLADIAVHKDLHEGIAFPGAGVTVRPTGVNLDQPAEVRDGRVFWANVAADTDFMVTMRPDGVETYDVLRSRQSPERLAFDVDVPAGGHIDLNDEFQSLEIKDANGTIVTRVAPPMAGDADGTRVPAHWTVQGNVVQIEIDHRLADLHYPILVDPAIVVDQLYWNTNPGIDFGGWGFVESNPNALAQLAGTTAWGRGLNIWLPGNLTVPAGLWGMWEFRAPGDTFVSRFEAGHLTWYPGGGRSCISLGILGSDAPVRWDPAMVSVGGVNDASPWGRCANQQPTGFANSYQTHSLQGDNWSTVTRGNAAAVQWWAPATLSGSDIDEIFLGGASVAITDDRGPVNFWQYGLPSGWTQNSTLAFSAYASDNGLGMDYMSADIDTVPVGEQELSCVPDPQHGALCPTTQRLDVTSSTTDGIHVIDVTGLDAVANGWDDSYLARVDTIAPKMEMSGAAYELRDLDVGDTSYPLHVHAHDDPADPNDHTTEVSGIASVEILIDGQVVSASPPHPCDAACLDGAGEDMDRDFTFNTDSFADGQHTLEVRVRDQAGNTTVSPGWKLTVVSGSVTNPRAGLRSSRRVTLEAHARRPGITSVRWEYRTAAAGATPAGAWTTIPGSTLRDTAGSPVSGTTFSLSGGDSPPVSWDISATPGLANRTQALDVRGVFSGGAGGTTNASRFTFDTKGLDGRTARESIGPGEVNLLTGNLALSSQDVAITGGLADLTLKRTFNSRDTASDGPVGPGWTFSNPVLDGGDSVARVVEPATSGYVDVVFGDGNSVPFSYTGSGLKPATGYEQYTLTKRVSSATGADGAVDREYLLTDATDGSSVILRNYAAGRATYYPEIVQQAASAVSSAAVFETPTGGSTRIKTLYAPAPPSIDCKASFATGCRSLQFIYATTTTATGSLPADWGEVAGRLSHIDFKAYDPATNSITIEAVESYTYDTGGRLRAEWDPRISPTLKTQYGYDANGLLVSLTPPGEQQWTFAYAPAGTDPELGRVTQVTRSTPAGPATWTVAYDVALSGTSAPFNMTPSSVAGWGQTDIPTDAAAIFPPDQVPALPTGNYTRADVHYLNRDGYEVNDLLPNGELSTSERDRYGNVVRELSARNRATAVAAASPVARSHELDTQRTYQAAGLELSNEIGPLHSVRLDSGELVDARMHTQYRYDEWKWSGDPVSYHLPTTTIVGAQIAGRADADARTTTTDYDWIVRKPTRVVRDSGVSGLRLVSTAYYNDTTGLVESRHQPSSPTTDAASTTRYVAYSAAANTSDPTCGGHPEWHGLPCRVRPAVQPNSSGLPALPTRTFTYDKMGQLRTETTTGSATRTKTITYDNAGRETQTSWTSGAGVAVPATTTSYDSNTGRVATRSAVVNGTTRTVQTDYDSVGRPSRHVDGTGQASTTSYDLLGRPLVTDDGKGTQTRSYDAVTGRLAKIVDSQAGTFAATYDADGNVVTKNLPNGLEATYKTDEAGSPIDLAYAKAAGCSSGCTWLHFGVTRSIHGQQRTLDSTMSQQTESYDAVGRLVEVRDTPSGQGCTIRQYQYDADSNRTRTVTHPPAAAGTCDLASSGQTTTHDYDAADRLTDTATQYDAFGRTTQLPATDAGGLKLVSTFYADDLTYSQTQGGTTNTYDLDPTRRIMVRDTESGGSTRTETAHYADDSDQPSWTETSATHWSRNVEGIDGDLAAIVDDAAGPVLQLTDLHGNVAATAATSTTKVRDVQVLEAQRTGPNWSVQPIRSLAPGTYVASARQNDASGNVDSATTHFRVTAQGKPDTAYVDAVTADGATDYWRFNDYGLTAQDQFGSHPGTYQGGLMRFMPGALSGDADPSVGFKNPGDAIVIRYQPWRTGDFTIETWVKTVQRGGTLLAQGTDTDDVSWNVKVVNDTTSPGRARATFRIGTRVLTATSAGRVDDGRWHHVTASFMRSGTARVSVDGTVNQTSTPEPSSTPVLALGFNEGMGSLASSASGSMQGTVTGATWARDGRFGGALSFANAGDAVVVPDAPALHMGSAMTVEAWVKASGAPMMPNGFILGKDDAPGAPISYRLDTTANTPSANFARGVVGNRGAGSQVLPAGTWKHIAMVYNAGTLQMYVNGQPLSLITGVSAPVDGGGAFRVGSLSAAGGAFFKGLIDEVRVYSRALTTAEIVADQAAPVDAAAGKLPSAAFALDEGFGTTAADSSGNGRDVRMTLPLWVPGKFGNALRFLGTSSGSLTDPGLIGAAGMTLETWVRTTGVSNTPAVGGVGFGIYGQGSATQGPGLCTASSCVWAPASTNGIWTHLTATWDKTALRLYVNGVLSGSVVPVGTPIVPNGIIGIGRDANNSTVPAFSGGDLDEIRVYPRALSASEISREWSSSVAQNPGGMDATLYVGKGTDGTVFTGNLDELATYSGVLSNAQVMEHFRTGRLSTALAAPTVLAPTDGQAVADATPDISGRGLDQGGSASNLRIDVFSATDLTQSPVQSWLGPRTGTTWSAQSVRGLAAGSYTAQVTQSDSAGRYGAATRTFSVAGAADPETGYATSVRSDSPAAYWRLGETSGTQAADDRTGHPGAYQGGPSLGGSGALSADGDKAPTLDGVDDTADAPNSSGFFDPGTGDFSVEAWIKTSVNGDQVIASKGASWQLGVTAGAGHVGQARFSVDGGTVVAYGAPRVDDGKWHHVVAVADRATGATVYVDGAAGAVTATPDTASLSDPGSLRIGSGPSAGFFTGQIDEVAVYAAVLPAARIATHYRLGALLDNTAPSVAITVPADQASSTDAAPTLTGTAGSATTDAGALTVTISPDPTAGPLELFDFDEFGVPRDTGAGRRYGYLGGKERSTELPSGVIAMGVRSYVPTMGRFLQTDPVDGGSANAYDYVSQDPMNVFDLDGMCSVFKPSCALKKAKNIAVRAERVARNIARSGRNKAESTLKSLGSAANRRLYCTAAIVTLTAAGAVSTGGPGAALGAAGGAGLCGALETSLYLRDHR